jgi:hypothetical protein
MGCGLLSGLNADGHPSEGRTTMSVSEESASLGETISEEIADQKRSSTQHLQEVARAAHRAADELQWDMPQPAGCIHEAAQSIEEAASNLRVRSIGELMSMADGFARRQPVAFFGGAVLAGFVLSRASSRVRPPIGSPGHDP